MSDTVASKAGVLILRGEDRRGTLELALRYLLNKPKAFPTDATHVPCNIDIAWVRGAGPYGGVMLRFMTNAATLNMLAEEMNRLDLEQRLNEGLDSNSAGMEALVCEAKARWDYDHMKAHRTYRRTGTVRPNGVDDELRHFLAILASDEGIDIASYDRVTGSNSQYEEGWRIFDLKGRGATWLDEAVTRANGLSGPKEDQASVEPLDSLDFINFAKATLQVERLARTCVVNYLYFRVHCPDRRGLFELIDFYARYAPGKSGSNARRPVVRSCCRGIGGQAVVLVVVEGSDEDRPYLEKGLKETLQKRAELHPAQFVDSRLAAVETVWATSGRLLDVKVTSSSAPPTVVGFSPTQEAFTVQFEAMADQAGILAEICAAASSVQEADSSVYYLDARTKPDPDGRGSSVFSCAIGWAIEARGKERLYRAVDHIVRPLCGHRKPPLYSWEP